MNDLQPYMDDLLAMTIHYAPKVVAAIITLILGLWIIKGMTNVVTRMMESRNLDVSLRPFLSSMFNVLLTVLLVISVASMIGIETTSFVAVLGAAGLAIGLALQGSLSNFAGGVLILIFKPYKVGDLINAQGHFGRVEEIHIFVTKLVTPENRVVIIPNGAISNGSIVNSSANGVLRVDLTIGISYADDIDKAREIMMRTIKANDKVLKDPEPMVAVSALADSSVNFAVRPFSTTENYWDVYFGVTEDIKKALDENGVTIPFPQRDVHMKTS